MAKLWEEKVCDCGSTYRTGNGSDCCYWCYLFDSAPEEGDFNSAHLAAGDMTEYDWYDEKG